MSDDEVEEVTELRQRADQLTLQVKQGTQNEELFRMLVQSVRDYAIFMLDPSGHIASWNAGAERIKGYRADEIIGRHFSTFYPEQDISSGKCEMELEVAAREGRFEEEGWRLRKDGTRFWANVVISAMRDNDGQLVGFSKVTRDLSDRKRAEEERAARLAAEERFRQLVGSVRDYAIFMLDPTGHVQTWNVGAERMKGYSAADIIGKHLSVFYPEEDVLAGKAKLELVVAARDGRFEDEGWRVRKDGTRFWANVVLSAIHDNDGTLVGFAKVTRDLTDRKRVEEERAARMAAEEANKAKDEFLAMLGHELRNPLAPIVTALQLMKLRGDSRTSRETDVIERQVKHMMHLVDDLLDVSRITKGKLELKRRPIDLRNVVAKAIEIASPLLEKNQHHFNVDVPPHPIVVDGDEARLTQVFANLLTNAAKYTDPGGQIDVEVSVGQGEAVVALRDNGVGIDPRLLPKLFDLFVQGYQTLERATGGLGIGLTLVRSLVHMHGGSVDAHSAGVGEGSTFTVRLPMLEAEIQPSQPERTTEQIRVRTGVEPRRILIVDDNEDARILLADALAAMGYEVQTAGDAVDALGVAKAFTPDLAILDIGLPVMDGYELAACLRREGLGTTRFFALTGYGQPSDRERSYSAGFAAHFVKPVNLKELLDRITDD